MDKSSVPGRSRRISVLLIAVLAASLLGLPLAGDASDPGNKPPAPDVAGVVTVAAEPGPARPTWTAEEQAVRGPTAVTWPKADQAVVELRPALVVPSSVDGAPPGKPAVGEFERAGSTPIRVAAVSSAAGADAGVTKASVRVYDRTAAQPGVLFEVGRADGRAGSAPVRIELDYSGFARAYGADYGSRLRLVALPACAVTTPELAACQQRTPVSSANTPTRGTVSATVSVSSAPMLLSAEGGASGDNGDYTATSLSPAGSWSVSTQTGDFSWSYALRMPPALGGPAPSVSLAYSSGASTDVPRRPTTRAPGSATAGTRGRASSSARTVLRGRQPVGTRPATSAGSTTTPRCR